MFFVMKDVYCVQHFAQHPMMSISLFFFFLPFTFKNSLKTKLGFFFLNKKMSARLRISRADGAFARHVQPMELFSFSKVKRQLKKRMFLKEGAP